MEKLTDENTHLVNRFSELTNSLSETEKQTSEQTSKLESQLNKLDFDNQGLSQKLDFVQQEASDKVGNLQKRLSFVEQSLASSETKAKTAEASVLDLKAQLADATERRDRLQTEVSLQHVQDDFLDPFQCFR